MSINHVIYETWTTIAGFGWSVVLAFETCHILRNVVLAAAIIAATLRPSTGSALKTFGTWTLWPAHWDRWADRRIVPVRGICGRLAFITCSVRRSIVTWLEALSSGTCKWRPEVFSGCRRSYATETVGTCFKFGCAHSGAATIHAASVLAIVDIIEPGASGVAKATIAIIGIGALAMDGSWNFCEEDDGEGRDKAHHCGCRTDFWLFVFGYFFLWAFLCFWCKTKHELLWLTIAVRSPKIFCQDKILTDFVVPPVGPSIGIFCMSPYIGRAGWFRGNERYFSTKDIKKHQEVWG